jgi:hypothetical protein
MVLRCIEIEKEKKFYLIDSHLLRICVDVNPELMTNFNRI